MFLAWLRKMGRLTVCPVYRDTLTTITSAVLTNIPTTAAIGRANNPLYLQ